MKLASCKSALTHPPPPPPPPRRPHPTPPPPPPPPPPAVVYSTDRSKAMVPVLALLFVALWFILRGDLFYILHCVFFSPFSIAITSTGEERANLSAFRSFVRFALFWFCLFPLPLGVWEGLRFVIVALPGLFSYLFLARRGSTIGFHLLWHTVELVMSTRLCLL